MNNKKKIKNYLNSEKKRLSKVSESIDYSWHSNALESIKRYFGENSEQYLRFKTFNNLFILSKAKHNEGFENKIESERKKLVNFFDETINFLDFNSPKQKKSIKKSIIKIALLSTAFSIGWAACLLFKFDFEKQTLFNENNKLQYKIDSLQTIINSNNNDSINVNLKNSNPMP
jgi:hypothetical protein